MMCWCADSAQKFQVGSVASRVYPLCKHLDAILGIGILALLYRDSKSLTSCWAARVSRGRPQNGASSPSWWKSYKWFRWN